MGIYPPNATDYVERFVFFFSPAFFVPGSPPITPSGLAMELVLATKPTLRRRLRLRCARARPPLRMRSCMRLAAPALVLAPHAGATPAPSIGRPCAHAAPTPAAPAPTLLLSRPAAVPAGDLVCTGAAPRPSRSCPPPHAHVESVGTAPARPRLGAAAAVVLPAWVSD